MRRIRLLKNPSLDEVRVIVGPIAKRYGIIRVGLFGSRARGDNRRNSDYDFVIDVTSDMSFKDYLGFLDDVSKALGRKVDVVTRESLRGRFRERILRDEVLIYG